MYLTQAHTTREKGRPLAGRLRTSVAHLGSADPQQPGGCGCFLKSPYPDPLLQGMRVCGELSPRLTLTRQRHSFFHTQGQSHCAVWGWTRKKRQELFSVSHHPLQGYVCSSKKHPIHVHPGILAPLVLPALSCSQLYFPGKKRKREGKKIISRVVVVLRASKSSD